MPAFPGRGIVPSGFCENRSSFVKVLPRALCIGKAAQSSRRNAGFSASLECNCIQDQLCFVQWPLTNLCWSQLNPLLMYSMWAMWNKRFGTLLAAFLRWLLALKTADASVVQTYDLSFCPLVFLVVYCNLWQTWCLRLGLHRTGLL